MTIQDGPGASESAVSIPDSVVSAPVTDVGEGFSADAGPQNLAEAFRAYVAKVKGGDPGALPALLGVVVLVVIFTAANSLFLTRANLANLVVQGAPTAMIGMGLIFVLLLGEIDLSAGTAAGVCSATMAIALANGGNLHKVLGGPYWAYLGFMLVGLVIALLQRLWPAAVIIAAGTVVLMTTAASNSAVAIFLCIATGTAIGVVTGFLVARVGIPSFIVTLAFFLAWQGVLILFIGQGGSISTHSSKLVNGLANSNVPPVWGWIMFVVTLGGYAFYTGYRSITRRRQTLSAEPMSLVIVRVLTIGIICGTVVYELNRVRGNNVASPIKGVPWVVPVILAVLVFWTLGLTKTSFGRYLYAVGGNSEAARRAGINVPRMRLAAFAISSSLAALGGVLLASYNGGVATDAGGNNTLLYAVAAAVIGGTSLFGGRGKMRDAVIGAVVISMIPNGLGLVPNLDSSYQFIVTGIVLLLAASVDALSRRRSNAGR